MKRHKVQIYCKCKSCNFAGAVHCAYKNKVSYYRCYKCHNEWEQRFLDLEIRQVKMKDQASFLGVFHGLWGKDEIMSVQGIFAGLVFKHDLMEEWTFFKGINFFSAWRSTAGFGKIQMAKNLAELMQKVKDRCLQNLLV